VKNNLRVGKLMLAYLQSIALVASLPRRRYPNWHSQAWRRWWSLAFWPTAMCDSLTSCFFLSGSVATPCRAHEKAASMHHLPASAPPLARSTLDRDPWLPAWHHSISVAFDPAPGARLLQCLCSRDNWHQWPLSSNCLTTSQIV
jgi:hypothetical protein